MLSTSLLLAASLVVGQADIAAEQTKANVPHVADLAWLVGDWQGEYVLPEGVPEMGPAGSKVVSMHTWRWTLGKKFITLRIQEEINGKVASAGEEILGKDQGTGALAHWFFGSTGIHGSGTWRRDGNQWELKWRGFGPGGKTYEAISDHVPIHADGYTWQMRDMTVNGNSIPDWPKVTYRRKAAAAPGEDELWQAFRTAAEGTWNGSAVAGRDYEAAGISKGDKLEMRFTLTSDLDGKVMGGKTDLQLTNKPLKLECRVLTGWDADARQVRSLAFWSCGLLEEIVILRHEGNRFVGTYAAKLPGSETQRARITMNFIKPDFYVIKFLDGPSKGTILSSWRRQE